MIKIKKYKKKGQNSAKSTNSHTNHLVYFEGSHPLKSRERMCYSQVQLLFLLLQNYSRP